MTKWKAAIAVALVALFALGGAVMAAEKRTAPSKHPALSAENFEARQAKMLEGQRARLAALEAKAASGTLTDEQKARLDSAIAAMKAKLEQFEATAPERQARFAEMQKRRAEMAADRAALQAKRAELQGKMAPLREQMKALQGEGSEIMAKQRELRSKQEELRGKIQGFKGDRNGQFRGKIPMSGQPEG